jgi:hypothetical protein
MVRRSWLTVKQEFRVFALGLNYERPWGYYERSFSP